MWRFQDYEYCVERCNLKRSWELRGNVETTSLFAIYVYTPNEALSRKVEFSGPSKCALIFLKFGTANVLQMSKKLQSILPNLPLLSTLADTRQSSL